MVGSAVVRCLTRHGYQSIVTRSRQELNLLEQHAVRSFFSDEKPDVVVLAAALVGGIKANMEHPAAFIYENMEVQNNVIHAAYQSGVAKFCFLGSSCIYPRDCQQPIKEASLLTGPLEPTNEGYALAKVAGLKLVEHYNREYGFPGISLMPCNLYGTNDHYDLDRSHVLSALVKKFTDAAIKNDSQVTVWGTGVARREFMHVDDMAEAVLFMLENYDDASHINVGWGKEISIKELAELIASKTGFAGEIVWDNTKPDGMLQKCLDVTLMRNTGYEPQISLDEGLDQTIAEYKTLFWKDR